jgi:Rrf2 family protein
MISRTTEYALRAMVILAKQPEKSWKTKDIAKITKVPTDYLSKVLQNLSRHKLVISQRGIKGGISLGKSAETITILDIANAVDPILRIKTCPLNLEEHSLSLCPLHKKLDHAIYLVEKIFQTTTLAELIDNPQSLQAIAAECF